MVARTWTGYQRGAPPTGCGVHTRRRGPAAPSCATALRLPRERGGGMTSWAPSPSALSAATYSFDVPGSTSASPIAGGTETPPWRPMVQRCLLSPCSWSRIHGFRQSSGTARKPAAGHAHMPPWTAAAPTGARGPWPEDVAWRGDCCGIQRTLAVLQIYVEG